jgi:hypothetical protein
MIRRFANQNGTLYALKKPEWTILPRPKPPKSILWVEDYYANQWTDLDSTWLKPIEDEFAKYYPRLADRPWETEPGSMEEGKAFIDWVAAMFCRTELLPLLTEEIVKTESPSFQALFRLAPDSFNAFFRLEDFENHRDVFTQPGWKWKVKNFSEDLNLVLTDHPVCLLCTTPPENSVLLVPLSRTRLIMGGRASILEKFRHTTDRELNLWLGAWANKRIYAASRETLEEVQADLQGKGIVSDSGWLNRAKKPLFGTIERVKSETPPDWGRVDTFAHLKRVLSNPSY